VNGVDLLGLRLRIRPDQLRGVLRHSPHWKYVQDYADAKTETETVEGRHARGVA
jgi:hypothetical protein